MKTVVNKYGFSVPSPRRAKLRYVGTSCKVGDTVYPIADLRNGEIKEGTPLVIKKMWKNKYVTVLEFEGTEFTAASILFRK